jgi:hypothetical protein
VSFNKLTKEELVQIRSIDNLGKGDRPGAYVRLWQLTGSPEALLQARISSFSGGPGGTSFAANLQLQKEIGSRYPGVFELSEAVFQSSIDDVHEHIDKVNSGKMPLDQALFDGAEVAWKARHLGQDFPGNIFSIIPGSPEFMDGSFFTEGSKVTLEGLGQAGSYGKTPDDFIGKPGYSTHMVAGVNGQKLLTIKEDKTGRTVYVGDGGEWEQELYDHALINGPGQSSGDILVRPNLLHRQALQSLRQHEEPGEIDISKTGVIKLLNSAKTQAMQQRKKKSAFQQMHQRLLQRAQARFAVAPVRTRPGLKVPVPRRVAGHEEGAGAALWRGGAAQGGMAALRAGAAAAAVAAARLGHMPAGFAAQAVVQPKAKMSAIPWPLAPGGAAVMAGMTGAPKRSAARVPASGAAAAAAQPGQGASLMAARQASGDAVFHPPVAASREARRGAMRDVVSLPDGNAVLAPASYAPDEAAAETPFARQDEAARAALDADMTAHFERLMHRESRRPPSGITGVDWRVAVPWPGLKTP